MYGRVLQKLLTCGEYDEFEDAVIVEGEFIEKERNHTALRQVIMGVTSQNLLIASRHIANYKLNPEVYYQTDIDPYLDGLEMSTIWPLALIRVAFSKKRYELIIRTQTIKRYYQMTNTHTNGNLEDTWARWKERVVYLREDPYGCIRNTCDQYNLPYPEYFLKAGENPDRLASDDDNCHQFELEKHQDTKIKRKKKHARKKNRTS